MFVPEIWSEKKANNSDRHIYFKKPLARRILFILHFNRGRVRGGGGGGERERERER